MPAVGDDGAPAAGVGSSKRKRLSTDPDDDEKDSSDETVLTDETVLANETVFADEGSADEKNSANNGTADEKTERPKKHYSKMAQDVSITLLQNPADAADTGQALDDAAQLRQANKAFQQAFMKVATASRIHMMAAVADNLEERDNIRIRIIYQQCLCRTVDVTVKGMINKYLGTMGLDATDMDAMDLDTRS